MMKFYKKWKKGELLKYLKLDEYLHRSKFKSYEELAKALEVTTASVYSWRKGRTLPRFDKALELADLLGIEPKKLLELLNENNKFFKGV